MNLIPLAAALTLGSLLLSACASGGDLAALKARNAEAIVDLRAFTVADLTAALTMAQARGDLAAMACYPAVLTVLASVDAQPVEIKGAVSAFEAVRLVVRPPIPRSDALRVACAALLAETVADLVKFDVAVAKAVGSGGASLAPTALPAAHKVIQLLHALGVGGAR